MQIFVELWRDNLQFYLNFALFSTLGGMNLDHNFLQVSKLSEEQQKKGLHLKWNTFFPDSGEDQKKKKKKKVFTKNGTLVFPQFKWRAALRCTPDSNYWGDADVDHTQIIGEETVKLLGGYIPPDFCTPVRRKKVLRMHRHFRHIVYQTI